MVSADPKGFNIAFYIGEKVVPDKWKVCKASGRSVTERVWVPRARRSEGFHVSEIKTEILKNIIMS